MLINDEFLEIYALMCQIISKPTRLKIIQLFLARKASFLKQFLDVFGGIYLRFGDIKFVVLFDVG